MRNILYLIIHSQIQIMELFIKFFTTSAENTEIYQFNIYIFLQKLNN